MTHRDAMRQLVRAIVDATSQSDAVSEALEAFEYLGVNVRALTLQLFFNGRVCEAAHEAHRPAASAETDADFLRKLRIEPGLLPPERSAE